MATTYVLLVVLVFYAIGLHFYSDRRQRKTINVLKEYALDLQMTIVDLAEGRRMDAVLIEDLRYDKEAAGFMLMTVMGELPSDHQFNFAAKQIEQRKERVNAIIKGMRAPRPGTKE